MSIISIVICPTVGYDTEPGLNYFEEYLVHYQKGNSNDASLFSGGNISLTKSDIASRKIVWSVHQSETNIRGWGGDGGS